jgi:hypothetical protein
MVEDSMPAKRIPGIGRINIRCEAWFADQVAAAAAKTGRSLSSYVRISLQEQMCRDGIAITKDEVVKKRGRPPKKWK